MAINLIEETGDEFNRDTQIKVIGVGGAGGNAVEHMIQCSVGGVEFICANTDAQALGSSSAGKIIQLGATGMGAGSKPDKGRDAAMQAEQEVRDAIDGAQMLFITAGMGGGTGTGAAPVIAKIAKEMGILTVSVVTKPFEFEGARRMKNAMDGLKELEANSDALIVVLNEKLLEVMGADVGQDEAFSHANDVLRNAVGGIAEIINVPGLVNVDFEDICTIMNEQGRAMMGTACVAGKDRAKVAAEIAIQCPLLEGVEISGAKALLVLVSASKSSLKLAESMAAVNTVRHYASQDANIIYGTAYDDALGDSIRVTVVATGLIYSQKQAPALQVLRTGTDDLQVKSSGFNGVLNFVQPSNDTHKNGAMQGAIDVMSDAAFPSVWRTNRKVATARVDALSSGGMDDYEIPAYLRKQAD